MKDTTGFWATFNPNSRGFNPGAAYLIIMAVSIAVLFSIAIPTSLRDQRERDDRFEVLKTICRAAYEEPMDRALCIDVASLKVYG